MKLDALIAMLEDARAAGLRGDAEVSIVGIGHHIAGITTHGSAVTIDVTTDWSHFD